MVSLAVVRVFRKVFSLNTYIVLVNVLKEVAAFLVLSGSLVSVTKVVKYLLVGYYKGMFASLICFVALVKISKEM